MPQTSALTGALTGKVVMVTGGTSGIGLAVAAHAVAAGAQVVIGGRRVELGEAVAAELGAVFVPCDITVDAEVARMVQVALDRFGALHGAVNNAGDVLASGQVHETPRSAWDEEIAVNLTSVYTCLHHEIPAIRASGGGSIVNNASLAAVNGIPGMAAYAAAKHGVLGLTKSAALENARHGVRINALVTGNVDTPLYRRLLGAGPDDPIEAPNPSGRVAEPAEVASFVTFLLSDAAPFITGADLPIDGGQTA